MIAQVVIDAEGGVTVIVDSDDAADDESARNLAGLMLDDMLTRAADTAVSTWLRLRTDDAE